LIALRLSMVKTRTKNKLPIFAFVVLLFGGFVLAQQADLPAQKIDGVAAIVGDRVVLLSDVNQSLAMAVFQQKLDPRRDGLKIQKLKDDIINTIVNRKVVLAMAELDSVEVDDKEVDRTLQQQVDNIVQQAGGEEAAEAALGQPLRVFKREYWYDVQDMLITQKYQQTLISKINISRSEVEGFYYQYRDSIPRFPTTAKIRHLLIDIEPNEDQVLKTKNLLMDIRGKILSGEKTFEEMALKYSQDPSAKQGAGSLGFVKRGNLVTAFESVAFNLSPGEISEPVKTEFGYHIIETEEVRGDKINVRHILITPPITEKDESIAYKKASALKDSSKTLSHFIDLVKKHSADEDSKKSGGNLGWINPDTYPIPEFGLILNQIKTGECAGPVRTDLGYHLVWLETLKPGGVADLKKHWTEIESMALNRKQAEWFDLWINKSKKNLFVSINN